VAAPTDLFIWDDHLGFDPRIDADLDRLERWRTAGASFLSINVGYDVMPWHDAIRVLAVYRAWIEAHGDGYVLAASTTDVMRRGSSARSPSRSTSKEWSRSTTGWR